MDVDEVAAALAEVALVDKPVGSWDEEEDSVRAALADESVVEAAARMDAEEEGLSEAESWSLVAEPPVLEQLIQMGVFDRESLKEMPSLKKRRLEQLAAAITGQQSIKWKGMSAEMREKTDNKNVSWQVKTSEGDERQGPTWVDLPPKWYAACEAVYRYTKEWTDTTWSSAHLTWDEHRQGPCGGPLCIKSSDIDSTGYLMLFGQREVHQQNIFTGTIRPVRRMEATWGEDGDIVYKTKEEQRQTMEAAYVVPQRSSSSQP